MDTDDSRGTVMQRVGILLFAAALVALGFLCFSGQAMSSKFVEISSEQDVPR